MTPETKYAPSQLRNTFREMHEQCVVDLSGYESQFEQLVSDMYNEMIKQISQSCGVPRDLLEKTENHPHPRDLVT